MVKRLPSPVQNIHALPNEILCKIFETAQSMPSQKGQLAPRLLVSHVTSHWRDLAVNMPMLWTEIRITRFSKLEVLRNMLLRSQQCGLEILLHFPMPIRALSARFRDSLRVRDTVIILASHISRWRRLSVIAGSETLRQIMKYVTGVFIPRLESLELVQLHTGPVSYYGPFLLDPAVFSSLRLERVTIHCARSSFLTGMRTLELIHSSGSILDEEALDSLDNPACNHFNVERRSPTMSQLTRLNITATSIILPFHPSFSASSLTSLKLANFPPTTPALRDSILHLFETLSTPILKNLEVEELDGFAWTAFVQSIHTSDSPKYPGLRSLTLSSLQLHDVDVHFIQAFPSITHLRLISVRSEPLRKVLRKCSLVWPGPSISVDGFQVVP